MNGKCELKMTFVSYKQPLSVIICNCQLSVAFAEL